MYQYETVKRMNGLNTHERSERMAKQLEKSEWYHKDSLSTVPSCTMSKTKREWETAAQSENQ